MTYIVVRFYKIFYNINARIISRNNQLQILDDDIMYIEIGFGQRLR